MEQQLPNDISYKKLYEPIQNIWFLNWILKQRGCDPYLNHIILSMPFTVKRQYWPNGRLLALKSLKNGQWHGANNGWFITGQLWWKSNMVNGKTNGLLQNWHESGQIKCEINWQNGQLHGLERQWNDNGQLLSERNWQRDEEIF